MAHSRTKRIATATLAAAAIVAGGGIAMAAPANAATISTDCPHPPTWSAGIELWANGGGTHCFEDNGTGIAPISVWFDQIEDATSGVNYANIYVFGHSGPVKVIPNQSYHFSTAGVTVTGVEITNG